MEFEYDALGRRTAKIADGKVDRYVWDENVLLHEWKYELAKRPQLVVAADGTIKRPHWAFWKNPNLYAYVPDLNMQIDPFGLDFFYQLIKDGKVVYNVITKNPIESRIGDHLRDIGKDFTEFKFLEADGRVSSRDLER